MYLICLTYFMIGILKNDNKYILSSVDIFFLMFLRNDTIYLFTNTVYSSRINPKIKALKVSLRYQTILLFGIIKLGCQTYDNSLFVNYRNGKTQCSHCGLKNDQMYYLFCYLLYLSICTCRYTFLRFILIFHRFLVFIKNYLI